MHTAQMVSPYARCNPNAAILDSVLSRMNLPTEQSALSKTESAGERHRGVEAQKEKAMEGKGISVFGYFPLPQ